VDIEDGKPALKLPYNLSENPYDRATKFLGDNQLPISYLESVANFIVENTKGAGYIETEPRHEPRDAAPGEPKALPHEEYISLSQINTAPLQKKILAINGKLLESGRKEFALNPTEEHILNGLCGTLSRPTAAKASGMPEEAVNLVLKLVIQWDYADRLPGLDLLRCMVQWPNVASLSHPRHGSIVHIALKAALEPEGGPPVNENSAMMAFRAAANLFATEQGRAVAVREAMMVISAMERVTGVAEGSIGIGRSNKNLFIALASTGFNYACLAYTERKKFPETKAMREDVLARLANVLGKVICDQVDSEVIYRALMAVGMLVLIGGPLKDKVLALGGDNWVRDALKKHPGENRVRSLGYELAALFPPGSRTP
jgi:phospholipase A-2-activating protein